VTDAETRERQRRSFEQRTMRYADLREMMEQARPAILEKARRMGSTGPQRV